MVKTTELFEDFEHLEDDYFNQGEEYDIDMSKWNKMVSEYCNIVRVDQEEFLNRYNKWKDKK